eukprot:gene18976-19318_t
MIETPPSAPDWTFAPLPATFPGRDRRAEPRRKVMWRAEADGAPCGVRDLNDGGARIILSPWQDLSGPLVLSIRHRRADYPADIVWRAGSAAGLRFLGASTLN